MGTTVTPRFLNLGCGTNKLDGFINVDAYGEPDFWWDLNLFPYPWPDNSVDGIEMWHVLEHRFYDGIAPVPLMLEKGVNVALSPDSEGINDDEDMFQEMRLAMLLSRRPPVTTKSLDEWDVLKMATTNGARAILMQDKLGTLEPGKEADITLVNLERIFVPYMNPSIGPVTALVYRGTPSDVDLVMVAGEVIYQEGRYLRFDVQAAEKKLGERMQKAYASECWAVKAMPPELIPYMEEYYKTWQIPDLDPVYVVNSRR